MRVKAPIYFIAAIGLPLLLVGIYASWALSSSGTANAPTASLSAEDAYATLCSLQTAEGREYVLLYDVFGTPTPNPDLATYVPTATAQPTLNAQASIERGREIFFGVGACDACHIASENPAFIGPPLVAIASRAATRIAGMSAADYLRASIMEPDAFIVPGMPPGIMPSTYGKKLSAQQLDDLIAYLLSI